MIPGSRSRNWCDHTFKDHFVQGLFNLFFIFYWNLAPGMLNRGNRSICPDGIGPGHVTCSVKRVRKALYNAIMSQTWAVVWGEVSTGNCASGQWRIGLRPWGRCHLTEWSGLWSWKRRKLMGLCALWSWIDWKCLPYLHPCWLWSCNDWKWLPCL